MEPEVSLPCSRLPATCPCPESDRSSQCLPTHFLKIHLNVILPYTPGSSTFCSLWFPHQNPLCTSPPHSCYTPLQFHSFRLITQIIFGEAYRSLSSSLCSFLHSHVTSFLLRSNILLSNSFSNTRRLCFSLNVSDHVSHPYKK
jgi:hypothetical protein